MEHDLRVLRDGIREGRQTFVNVMKYITMATSSNFGNMFSMAGAVLILPFLPMLPVQILLNNLLYDVSELALPFDRVDEEAIAKPSHWDMALVQRSMITIGPVSSVFDYVTFLVLLHVFRAGESLFQTAWFVESIATQVLVVFIIRTRRRLVASHPHPALAALAIAVVIVSAALPFMASSSLVGFVPLPANVYAAIAAIVIAYLLTMEGVKHRLWK